MAVVRCFETCSPAREAAEAAAPKLTDRLVDALADLREESEVSKSIINHRGVFVLQISPDFFVFV